MCPGRGGGLFSYFWFMIRIIMIDDHTIIGTGLKNSFQPSRDGIQIMKLYENVDKAIKGSRPSGFDMIILDLWIGKADPEENVRKLKDRFPGKPILVFTGEEDPEWKRKMMQAGVNGYISKMSMIEEIKRAILSLF